MTSVEKTENPDFKQDYRREVGRKVAFVLGSLVVLVVLVILSCAIGTGYGFLETYQIIVDRIVNGVPEDSMAAWWADHYVCENVLPGIVAAVVAGAGLSLTGAVMQSMMGNPLADPYTTGISSGACFGAVTAITMGLSFASMAGEASIVAMAFVGALVPAILIILLSRFINTSPSTLILIGTAISYFFNALVTYVMTIADANALQDAFIWQIGAVSDLHWSDIPLMLGFTVVGSILIMLVSNKLNLMMMGDDSAKTMGLDVDNFRTICLVLVSILIASIISFTGIIGFVGLITPHITRFIIGGDNKFVIPASMLMGSIILCLADVISRCLLDFGNVPIGVVMSFIGAPVFLYLVVRSKSDKEVF